MIQIPDEPSIARTLRTGYPQKLRNWNRENIWELCADEFSDIILKRGGEKRNSFVHLE